MNLFTIFAVLGFSIANAQRNWNQPSTQQPLFGPCESLPVPTGLPHNLTWSCQKHPCKELHLQGTRYIWNEYYRCNLNDNSEICCPEIVEHKGEANTVVTERGRNRLTTGWSPSTTPRSWKKGSASNPDDESLIQELQAKRFNKFDRDLLSELLKENRNKNLVVSPASVKSLLALLVEGSSEDTAGEILKLLQLKSEPKDRPESVLLLRKLQSLIRNNRTSISLESQNRMYTAKNVAVKEDYEDTLKRFYSAGVEAVDFSKPAQASDVINKWINDVTHGLIPSVVEEDNIHADTKLFLVNYIYLKANWDVGFNPTYTRSHCFYPSGSEKDCHQVKFMNKKRSLNYTDSAEYKSEIFEIPFKDPRYTIVFMLPHKDTNVHNVLKNLDRRDLFALFKDLQEDSINLAIPRTVIEFSTNLVQPLQQLGLKSVFEKSAKLTNMLKKNARFAVNGIMHKARIEINEEGAEAAGVAGANIQTLSLDVDRSVTVNRPFLFFIRDTTVNGFLFEGVVFSPDPAE